MNQLQAGKPLSASQIWVGAKTLRPYLAERSDAIEAGRRLPEDIVAAMHDKGLFRLNMPKIWGGPEMTSMEQVEVIEEVSRGDASAGWCLMIGCDTGIYSGYLDDQVARALYPRLDMVQAGWVWPAGRAHETEGGYHLEKTQWAFGSGSTHADLIAGGCVVFKDGQPKLSASGEPATLIAIAPAQQWEVLDTWYTTGLCGTGSNDYTLKEDSMFVPWDHTFSWSDFDMRPRRAGVLWQQPDTLLRKMPGIPLGVGRAAIDFAVGVLKDKVEMPGNRPLRQSARVQTAVAEAEMHLGAARAYVFHSLETQWRKLERHETLTDRERADVWSSRVNAFQTARQVAQAMYDVVGASSIYSAKGLLDRALRDTTTMCQHLVGQHKALEAPGALLLNADARLHNML